MPYILSTGIKNAEHSYTQSTIQNLIEELFPLESRRKRQLLPIFNHAQIDKRQFAEKISWFKEPHGAEERNRIYINKAVTYAKKAIEHCLQNKEFLQKRVPPSEIDHIIFVSSTGVATPTVDAFLINELSFKTSVIRTPLFGLGCAGGTSGIARACDWLKGEPEKSVLVVCVELCSLTFQLNDSSISNFVGTALFGDGASAVLVVGDDSSLKKWAIPSFPKLIQTSSKTKRDTTDVMGWKVVDNGFEVIFNKSIPNLVKSFWKDHLKQFLMEIGWRMEDLSFLIAHPGGKKVLQAYESSTGLSEDKFFYSRNVLKQHGNMSSPTVHYVLHQAMLDRPLKGTKSIMTSLGPGFTSEIISVEWS